MQMSAVEQFLDEVVDNALSDDDEWDELKDAAALAAVIKGGGKGINGIDAQVGKTRFGRVYHPSFNLWPLYLNRSNARRMIIRSSPLIWTFPHHLRRLECTEEWYHLRLCWYRGWVTFMEVRPIIPTKLCKWPRVLTRSLDLTTTFHPSPYCPVFPSMPMTDGRGYGQVFGATADPYSYPYDSSTSMPYTNNSVPYIMIPGTSGIISSVTLSVMFENKLPSNLLFSFIPLFFYKTLRLTTCRLQTWLHTAKD